MGWGPIGGPNPKLKFKGLERVGLKMGWVINEPY